MGASNLPPSSTLEALRLRIAELERENLALAERAAQTAVAERAHWLSETRFRALFEQFPLSVQIFAPDGQTLAVNRAWHELFGLTFADVAAFNPLHDPQLEPIREYLQRGFAGEVVTIPPHPFDPAPFNGDPGSTRQKWLEVTVWPVRDDGGEICEVIVAHRDVTEQKVAEAALHQAHDELEHRVEARTAELAEAEHRFRAIVEASPVPLIFSHIRDGTVVFTNERLESLVGATPGDILGRKTPDFYYDPADRPAILQSIQEQGNVRNAELRIKRFDGTPRWVSLSIQHIVLGGEPTLATALVDITERKEIEEALREQTQELEAIFRALPDLYFRMEADGTILAYRAGRAFGLYAPPDAFLGKRMQAVLPEPVGSQVGEALAEVARTGDLVQLDYTLPLGDERREFEARLLPLADEQVIAVVRDVTDQKRAEDAIRASEESYRGLFDSLTELVYIQSLEGQFLAVNEAVVSAYGYTRDEIVGQTPDFLGVPETVDPEAFAEVFARAVGGESQRFEWWGRRKDGSTFPKDVVIKRSTYFGQDVVLAVARNITAQKEADDALRRSEEHFRRLTENGMDLIQLLDTSGTTTYVSPSVERLLGFTPEEMVGQPAEKGLHRDDVDDALASLAAAVAHPGRTQTAEYRVRHRDGSWRVFEGYGRTFAPDSPDEGIVINARDITERRRFDEALRESEERFRSLIEDAHDITCTLDIEGVMTYLSPSVQRNLGWEPEELTGQSAFAFIHLEDADQVVGTLGQIVANPGTTGVAEYRFRHKDGSWRLLEGIGRTLSPTSMDEGIVVNIRDITERKEAEAEVLRQRAYFEEILNSIDAGIAVFDAAGRHEYISPKATPDPELRRWMIGKNLDEYAQERGLPIEILEQRKHSLNEALATRTANEFEQPLHTPDKTTHTMLRRLVPILDEAGEVLRMVGYSIDITERKAAEETLRFQKTLLEAQGEASIDGILVISPAGEMVSFNRRFVEMWELPPEVAASQSDETALQAVVNQLADPDAFLARVAYLYDHPDEESRDEILLRDERIFDRYSAPVRSQEGDHYGRIWFFRDITERKRAEEALHVSHEREREHAQRLEEELEVGRQIQLSFLPAELTRPPGWEVEARFQPALQVAGDFYDTFGLPIGRIGLIIADVCGKGVGAALYMALFRSLLRAHAERASASRHHLPHAAEAVLKEAVNATNQYIARVHRPTHLRKLGHTFASVFFGLLDPETGTLHYVNAGHEPPVVIGLTGPRLRLRPTGPALGLVADASIGIDTIQIAPGETLLAFTDGVTEARNTDGGFFDEHRLLTLLDEPVSSAASLLDRIERAVHQFTGAAAQSDDVTLMAIRRIAR